MVGYARKRLNCIFFLQLSAVNGQQATEDDQLEFNYKQIKLDFLIIGHGLVESLIDNRDQSEINVK